MDTGSIMTREEFSAEMQAFSKDVRERFSGKLFDVKMRLIHIDGKLDSNDLDHVRIGHKFDGIDRHIQEAKDELADMRHDIVRG